MSSPQEWTKLKLALLSPTVRVQKDLCVVADTITFSRLRVLGSDLGYSVPTVLTNAIRVSLLNSELVLSQS